MFCYRWEMRHTVAVFALLLILVTTGRAHSDRGGDVLPSWNDGPTRTAVIDFVTAASREGDPGYIAPDARLAVFDMDGTLMPEKPLPGALLPLVADVKTAVTKHPELKQQPGVAALLAGDLKGLQALGETGLAQIVAAAIDGRTVDEVSADMAREERVAPNPHFGQPYTKLAYRPMVELLRYLEANGFQT